MAPAGSRGAMSFDLALGGMYVACQLYSAAIGRVLPCRPHGRASISNFIYRALDLDVSTGIVMGAAPMTIPVDTSKSSTL